MTARTVRLLIAALVCVALTAGGVFGVAAASHDDDEYDADLTVEGSVDSSQASGNGTYDCVGDVNFRHHCDKDASVDAGPASVDYFGDNWARPTETEGGGGDVFTVGVGEENATVGFDCHLRATPEQHCAVVTDADDYDGDP
jgi:hypothetical protein